MGFGIGICREKMTMSKKYMVAGYVKNALLWKNRNPEEMIRYNRKYFEEQFQGDDEAELVDVYIDVTGNKETYKRPEMVRLLRDITLGKINLIYARTAGYIAANAYELCYLMMFLFEQEQRVDLFTEDPVYQFNTIDDYDNQLEELRRMATNYCNLYQNEYKEWKEKLVKKIEEIS